MSTGFASTGNVSKRVWQVLIAIYLLAGGIAIAQPEVAIEADTIEYDQSSSLVLAEGNFIVRQGGAELKGDRGSYNNASGQSIFTGNAALVVDDRQFETLQLEGNHRNQIFLLEGNVTVPLGAETELRAEAMIYRGETGEASLVGPVEVVAKQWRATGERAKLMLQSGELVLFDGWREPIPSRIQTQADAQGEHLPNLLEDRDSDRRDSFSQLVLDLATHIAILNPVEP